MSSGHSATLPGSNFEGEQSASPGQSIWWMLMAIPIILIPLTVACIAVFAWRKFNSRREDKQTRHTRVRSIDPRGYPLSASPPFKAPNYSADLWPFTAPTASVSASASAPAPPPTEPEHHTKTSSFFTARFAQPRPLTLHTPAQASVSTVDTALPSPDKDEDRKPSIVAPLPFRALSVSKSKHPRAPSILSFSCAGDVSSGDMGDGPIPAPALPARARKPAGRRLTISNPNPCTQLPENATDLSTVPERMTLISLEQAQDADRARREGRKVLTLEPKASPAKSPHYAAVPVITPGLGRPRVQSWETGIFAYEDESGQMSPGGGMKEEGGMHPGTRVA